MFLNILSDLEMDRQLQISHGIIYYWGAQNKQKSLKSP